jgi:GcrA cell cycle regulator
VTELPAGPAPHAPAGKPTGAAPVCQPSGNTVVPTSQTCSPGTRLGGRFLGWTPAKLASLQELWDQHLSASEIGARIGTTKNAVLGKAHRLKLPSRPVPIRPRGSGKRPQAAMLARSRREPEKFLPQPACLSVVSSAPEPSGVVFYERKPTACCWPIGEPRVKGFRFCDDTALIGGPYCAAHHTVAYHRVPAIRVGGILA